MFVGNKNRQICITVSCLISSLQITAIRSCSSQREKGALVTTASAIVLDSVRTVVFAGLVHVQLIQQHRAERSEVETVRDNEALFVVHGGTSPVIFVNEKHEMRSSRGVSLFSVPRKATAKDRKLLRLELNRI